ncbi:MAG: type II toxin-antitoxin system prevent-host-death family antitoxin [Sandaracinaceae bacterium]|jgi:prevent-host-death family protein|nr:type II toxin-antitoxin system prevent-host-death family antitoxin [Sandaracinaceae bacterium]
MKRATAVGLRELKNATSALVRRAQAGEVIVVTDRGTPIVQLTPIRAEGPSQTERLASAVSAGRLSWSGGKPRGLDRAPRVGASVSHAVLEDRR